MVFISMSNPACAVETGIRMVSVQTVQTVMSADPIFPLIRLALSRGVTLSTTGCILCQSRKSPDFRLSNFVSPFIALVRLPQLSPMMIGT